jgi:hypothetical protein
MSLKPPSSGQPSLGAGTACCFTMDTLAAFCGLSRDTVKRLRKDKEIPYSKMSGRITFTIEDVAEYRAAHYVSAKGMKPGESERYWADQAREFLGMRVFADGRYAEMRNEINKIKERVDALSAELTSLKFKAQGSNGANVNVELPTREAA